MKMLHLKKPYSRVLRTSFSPAISSGRTKLLVTICLSILLCCPSCKKESNIPGEGIPLNPNGLPDCTTDGSETFWCLIDDEPWFPLVENSQDELEYDISFELANNGNLSISALDLSTEPNSSLTIGTGGVTECGVYEAAALYFVQDDDCFSYEVPDSLVGRIEIVRLDTDNQVLSGKFAFDLVSDDCPTDTVRITSGCFDLQGN
jgi:hypothetical protein